MAFSLLIDPTHPTLAEFIPWAQENPTLVCDVVSLGFIAYKYGIVDRYSDIILNKNSSAWITDCQNLRDQLNEMQTRMASSLKNSQREADDALARRLAELKKHHDSELADAVRDKQSVASRLAELETRFVVEKKNLEQDAALARERAIANQDALNSTKMSELAHSNQLLSSQLDDVKKALVVSKDEHARASQLELQRRNEHHASSLKAEVDAVTLSFKTMLDAKTADVAGLIERNKVLNDRVQEASDKARAEVRANMQAMLDSALLEKDQVIQSYKDMLAKNPAGAAYEARIKDKDNVIAMLQASVRDADAVKAQHDATIRSLTGMTDKDIAILRKEAEASYNRQLAAMSQVAEAKRNADVAVAQANATQQAQAHILSLTTQVAELKASNRDAKAALQEATSGSHARVIQTLTQQNNEHKASIALMQKNNMAKGHLGENAVFDLLKKTFPKLIHERMGGGKQAHVCDIHMSMPTGELVAVECKYKQTITQADVKKFYSDLDTLVGTNRRCVAGVFVSVATRNIPGKGEMAFEMVKNMPVLFIGFDGVEALESLLPPFMQAIVELAKYHDHASANANNIEDVIRAVKPVVDRIVRIQRRMEKSRLSIQELSVAVQDTENDAREMALSLANIIQGNYAAAPSEVGTGVAEANGDTEVGPASQEPPPVRSAFTCHCGRVCKNRGGLKKHMRGCVPA